jgi:cell division protein ZapB
MSNSSYSGLEEKVDELIQLCADMKAENQALRDQTSTLKSERKSLLDKNQLARVRLEKVLRRLKTLEQNG